MNESMDERATLVTPLSTEPLTEGAIRQAQDNAQRLNVIHSRLMAVCSRIGVPPAPGKPRADEDRKVADSFLGKFKERRARPGRRSRAGPQLEEIAMRKAAAVISSTAAASLGWSPSHAINNNAPRSVWLSEASASSSPIEAATLSAMPGLKDAECPARSTSLTRRDSAR